MLAAESSNCCISLSNSENVKRQSHEFDKYSLGGNLCSHYKGAVLGYKCNYFGEKRVSNTKPASWAGRSISNLSE